MTPTEWNTLDDEKSIAVARECYPNASAKFVDRVSRTNFADLWKVSKAFSQFIEKYNIGNLFCTCGGTGKVTDRSGDNPATQGKIISCPECKNKPKE